MCEILSYILLNTKTQRHRGTKFLYIKYYVVSLCLRASVFTLKKTIQNI